MRFAVYDIVVNGETWYVGFTNNPEARKRSHLASERWPESFELVVVSWHDTEDEARLAEGTRIWSLSPKHNVLLRRDDGRPPTGAQRKWDRTGALLMLNKGMRVKDVAKVIGVNITTITTKLHRHRNKYVWWDPTTRTHSRR